jgi:predicted MFS family arabinose efflux permease
VANDKGARPKGRFSKSGHTSHRPPPGNTSGYPAGPDETPTRSHGRDPSYSAPEQHPSYGPPTHYAPAPPSQDDIPTSSYQPPPAEFRPPPHPSAGGAPTAALPAGAATKTATGGTPLRTAVSGTNRAARVVTRKVIDASKSDGAEESGLTPLIWNQVLSYGTDAMVTVALAGTVFFGASAHAQRGNVLLYLLITMAPFAVIAPVIGPLLDRLQHGRRWTMAGTAIGRAILALIMAANSTDLLVLYPCALGSLVLSKAYGVVRAAAAPRLVPPNMTLTKANAKLTIFGLASTVVLGTFVGLIIKVSGSYTAGLLVTAIGFATCAFFAFKLPKQVDSTEPAPRHPQEPRRGSTQQKVPPFARLVAWASRGFDPHLVIALQGESALRLLSGMLTIYLAFYVESTQHGWEAALELGLVIGAAGVGNFLGTAIGTRVHMSKPEIAIIISVSVAAAFCAFVAIFFSVLLAAVAMLVSAVGNALSKIALDSLIQHDVVETLRSSAFGRSETFLQLAWVMGAAIGVVLPSHTSTQGTIAFVVAAVITGAVAALTVLRNRAVSAARDSRTRQAPPYPGAVGPRTVE